MDGLPLQLHNYWSDYYKKIERHVKDLSFQSLLHSNLQSFGVTAPVKHSDLEKLRASFKTQMAELATTDDKLPEVLINQKNLRERFEKRVLRLTTTDDALTNALMAELTLRLADATPFLHIPFLNPHGQPLCGDTVIVISEVDTSYTRSFLTSFKDYFRKDKQDNFSHCTEDDRPRVHAVHT